MKTNPNGANQYQLDPRQKLCWDSYVDPKSETFGNAYQSALKAGYEEDTATKITDTDWFGEKRRRMNLLSKAEKRLEKMLDLELTDAPIEDLPKRASLIGIQTDIAKFVAETQGKAEGYSKRSELTGAGGESLTVQLVNYANTVAAPVPTEAVPASVPESDGRRDQQGDIGVESSVG